MPVACLSWRLSLLVMAGAALAGPDQLAWRPRYVERVATAHTGVEV